MITTVLVVLAILLAGGTLGTAIATSDSDKPPFGGKVVVVSWIFAALIAYAGFSFHQIEAGYVGVVTSFGQVRTDTLKPGLNFLPAIVNNVTSVETRVRGIPFENLGAASKEYQDVILTGTLNIHIDQNAVVVLYQNVGLDYDNKIVIPFFANAIKEVVPQYAIGEVLDNREEIRKQAVVKLAEKLLPYGLVVDDVAISNIDFSQQYKQAIEEKQVQEQRVAIERNILEQKRIQADQARAEAQGRADASVITAQGQAEANKLLQLSLTPELIQYTLIQKLSPTITTIILPDGQNFILDPKSLVKQ